MILRLAFLLIVTLLGCHSFAADSPTLTKRKALLEQLQRLLPPSEAWNQWLAKTGELPPDFATLPSLPNLPEALRFADGSSVKDREQWAKRRIELLTLFEHYLIGSVPPAPGNTRVAEMKTRQEDNVTIHDLLLEFGPDHQCKLHAELIIPRGNGPFPVFITQDNHRRWALAAVSRGYFACVYAGADSRDDTANFIPAYPAFDWTKLARRAWAASRCIDYLHTLPLVDKSQIALTGHSRNGKLSLIAAALDERIKAVISSSSGAGGPCCFRDFSECQFGESIEQLTRVFPDWFHPRLRFFSGRENYLPIDQHELLTLIAPRPCLISTALNDSVESVWAVERALAGAVDVYSITGDTHDLNLRYRPGGHETRAEDIEAYLDWLDTKFGRKSIPVNDDPIFPTYFHWVGFSGEEIDPKRLPEPKPNDLLQTEAGNRITRAEQWQEKKAQLRVPIQWALGNGPAVAKSEPGDYGAERPHLATLLGRNAIPVGLVKKPINFGNYINGDLWFPTNSVKSEKKLPVVIWLHPVSIATGYVPGYKRGEAPHLALARQGFAVFCFDQIGNGSRLEEVRNFYARYPNWSLLGKTVADIRAAVDALTVISNVDAQRIYLLGYDTGAKAALHAAALDERVAGVVSVAGFTPMRTDTAVRGTGGLARWSQWLPLQPRLGPFIGQEARVPYDYHELLALIAPRPVVVIAPQLDWQTNAEDLARCVSEAATVYELLGAQDRLRLLTPEDFNHFSPELQKLAQEQLSVMLRN